MVYNADIHHRKSIRLKGYDYAQASLYFITLCTENRTCLLGKIDQPDSGPLQMVMNAYGEIVKNTWLDLPNHVSNIRLHECIVMPNHIHDIIEIDNATGKPQPLPEIVRQLKIFRPPHQSPARHACPCYLAAQLLRTHHSQRTGLSENRRIHPEQSLAMAGRHLLFRRHPLNCRLDFVRRNHPNGTQTHHRRGGLETRHCGEPQWNGLHHNIAPGKVFQPASLESCLRSALSTTSRNALIKS